MWIRAGDDVSQFRSLNVRLQQGKPARARAVEAERMLEVGRNARTEVVDSHHLMAFGQETVDQS